MTHTAMGMRTRRERKDTAEGNAGSERLAGGRPANHIVCDSAAYSAIVHEFFRSTPESNPSRYSFARRRDSTCARPPTNPNNRRTRLHAPTDSACIEAQALQAVGCQKLATCADSGFMQLVRTR